VTPTHQSQDARRTSLHAATHQCTPMYSRERHVMMHHTVAMATVHMRTEGDGRRCHDCNTMNLHRTTRRASATAGGAPRNDRRSARQCHRTMAWSSSWSRASTACHTPRSSASPRASPSARAVAAASICATRRRERHAAVTAACNDTPARRDATRLTCPSVPDQ
jgi:hypothetical protein